ncbi:MAG: hypothetical protein AAF458_20980 [Pseudomonadota bacterium]
MMRDAQGWARSLRRWLHACGAAIAFSAGLFAVSIGVADLLATDARQFLDDAAHANRGVTHARWQQAVDGLRRARHLNPWNADYTADMARLYIWQSWQQVERPGAAEAYTRAAAHLYRETLARRPSWGYAWAELADTVATTDGISAEVETAVRLSGRLAPYEQQALRRVLWVALPSWPALDADMRDEVRTLVRNALRLNSESAWLTRLAARFDWQQELTRLRQQHDIGAPSDRETAF